MRTIIHVGLQKTASTMLQRNLYRNRSKLARAGMGYARLRPLNETDDLQHLPSTASSIRAVAMPKRKSPDPEQLGAELAWLRSQGHESLIITDENILGPINHESGNPAYARAGEIVDWLITTLHPDSYRVILYVRSQDTYLESTYLHRIHIGKSLRFQKYMNRADIDSLDWDGLASSIASRIGRGNLHVIPYETIAAGELAFVNRFLQLAATDVRLKEGDLTAQTSNRSYSAMALEMALRCNDMLEGDDLRAFRDFLQTNYSNATHPRPVLLDDESRADLKQRFAESNKAVLRKYSAPEDHADGFA